MTTTTTQTEYEILFADDSTCTIVDTDPLDACQRAADLHGKDVQAWRRRTAQGTIRVGY